MPATLEPPVGSPSVNIIDAPPPKPPPAPTRTIKVSEMAPPAAAPTDKGPPLPEPKRGSAMDRLQSDLRKKAGVAEEPTQPAKPPTETPPAEPVEQPPTEPPPTTEPKPGEAPAAIDPKTGKPGKPNPWKLVDEYKARATTLEKENLDLKRRVTPESDRKAFEERITKSEARVKELEDEIRFVNFEKHPDFIRDYQQPYDRAWTIATQELAEIGITDPQSGQQRAATPADLMQLVQLPLGQAREVADQLFGKFADDIMGHRKEIRALFEKRSAALKDAKENGGAREKSNREASERQSKELNGHIVQTWEKVNKEALEDPKYGSYFKQKEGDQEWNQRLGKGFQLVDQAYSENPTDPKLSPEQRASVIKRQAAVRNRAASWGALRYDNERLIARLAEVEKELAQYKETVPPSRGSEAPQTEGAQAGTAMERMLAELRKKAK